MEKISEACKRRHIIDQSTSIGNLSLKHLSGLSGYGFSSPRDRSELEIGKLTGRAKRSFACTPRSPTSKLDDVSTYQTHSYSHFYSLLKLHLVLQRHKPLYISPIAAVSGLFLCGGKTSWSAANPLIPTHGGSRP